MRELFRAARPASTTWNLTKTAAMTAVFWVLFLWLLPWVIVTLEARAGMSPYRFEGQAVVAWASFVLFAFLNLWSGVAMARLGGGTPLPLDMANHLVVRGPYRFLRNPMAVGGLGAGAAIGLYLGSLGVVAYAVAGGLLWHVAVRPAEERDLQARFGTAYGAYKAKVRCWIPSRPYTP